MFILSNLIAAIANILDAILTIFYWLILVRAVISWFSLDPFNPIVQFLHTTTEPILVPVRRILPLRLRFGMVDISPVIVFFAIMFLKSFLIQTLFDISIRMKP